MTRGRRSRIAPLLLVVFAAGAVLSTAEAENADGAGKRPKVACFHYGSQNVSFKAKPGRCDFMRPGCDIGACDLPTKSLKWKHWGRPHARATGKGFITTVGWRPIKIQLSKIRDPKCGGPVYTKLKAWFRGASSGGSSRLDRCRR